MTLAADRVAFARGARPILRELSLTIHPGEVLAVVGPNGAGKSTLLGLLAGELAPSEGAVRLDGVDLRRWPLDGLATRRALLPQASRVSPGLGCRELVELGASGGAWRASARVRTCVAWSFARCGAEHLASRRYDALSGGEQQLVQLVRVLAQLRLDEGAAGKTLLLDEPTASLDLARQHRLLALVRSLAASGLAVVVILHDLGLAARYGDRVALVDDGRLVVGAAETILAPERLARAFAVDATWTNVDGAPHLAVRGAYTR
jgi:iron complex transport system ATP-binding protein